MHATRGETSPCQTQACAVVNDALGHAQWRSENQGMLAWRFTVQPMPREASGQGPRRAVAARRLAVAATTWCFAVAVSASGDPEPKLQACMNADQAHQAVAVINAWRERGGAPCSAGDTARRPLTWAAGLSDSAREHAGDLAARGVLSHEDRQQRGLAQRLRSVGYQAVAAAENLAVGQPNFEAALQAWLHSPQHCNNLMAPDYSEVGLACVVNPGSQHTWYWVAQLSAPQRR